MRCSAVSILSNIAEGYGRKGTGEYIHFLKVAHASSTELETQLIITKNVHGLVSEVCESLIFEVQKMLIFLINKLNTKI
jgi:four helix bundle protein